IARVCRAGTRVWLRLTRTGSHCRCAAPRGRGRPAATFLTSTASAQVLYSPEDFGLALVILSLVFAGAALIRRWSPPLRALFLPTAVIGGFLALALGPEGFGRLIGGNGIFADQTFGVWKALPGLLVNVMAASLLLGERLPAVKKIWAISGPHVIMAGAMSAGQFAVGSILVLVLLAPVFGISDKAAALIEMSFAGGHGPLPGLAPLPRQFRVGA